jgi:hypothetical protein
MLQGCNATRYEIIFSHAAQAAIEGGVVGDTLDPKNLTEFLMVP